MFVGRAAGRASATEQTLASRDDVYLAMMMFYFDLQTDGVVSKDTEGTDLADLDAARREASRAAREMAAAAVASGNEAPVDDILITETGRGARDDFPR
jgi:hypothetical protein